MRRIRIYFGDDAVWYIGLNAIAKLNGIGNGNGEERLRGRRRSRALWRTGETSLLFHIISHKFKLYHQIIIKSKFNRKRRKTIEKKRERERERARIVLCFACLFCENGEWWQICNYRGIHGRFWGFGIASRDRAARRTCLVPENEWGVVTVSVWRGGEKTLPLGRLAGLAIQYVPFPNPVRCETGRVGCGSVCPVFSFYYFL